jgi:diguanylate cyclase (GGDEF)-like protein
LHRVLAGETEILEPTEIKLIRSNGDVIDVEVKSRMVKYQGKLVIQSIGRDITERKKTEDKIKFMAYHDNLTQLPNRLYFNQLLQSEIVKAKQYGEKIAVLFIDIDNFKEVNDSIGHHAADEVLKLFSKRVSYCVPPNAIVARVSGDEFSILLPNVKDMLEIVGITKKILDACKPDFSLGVSRIKITISMGISVYPTSGEDSEELMKNADLAMHIAKQKGKNTYQLFTEEIKENIAKKRRLNKDLTYAISDNQFLIYYQPVINLEKNDISSVEALIRWNHPKKGLISPVEFIPLVEENGLIIEIGEWVLRSSCLQVKQWQREGLSGLALKVNLSVRQLEQENFVEMMANVLDDTGFDSELLELEITESVLMRNTEQMIEVFDRLKLLNVKISLDDFGKGFSSLCYLTQFPFDILKIDRSFIQKMLLDEKSAAIVKIIINLAKQLNLRVVAEGVETEAQLSFLINNQCEEVQGFLFNKPLSVQDFELEYLQGQLT